MGSVDNYLGTITYLKNQYPDDYQNRDDYKVADQRLQEYLGYFALCATDEVWNKYVQGTPQLAGYTAYVTAAQAFKVDQAKLDADFGMLSVKTSQQISDLRDKNPGIYNALFEHDPANDAFLNGVVYLMAVPQLAQVSRDTSLSSDTTTLYAAARDQAIKTAALDLGQDIPKDASNASWGGSVKGTTSDFLWNVLVQYQRDNYEDHSGTDAAVSLSRTGSLNSASYTSSLYGALDPADKAAYSNIEASASLTAMLKASAPAQIYQFYENYPLIRDILFQNGYYTPVGKNGVAETVDWGAAGQVQHYIDSRTGLDVFVRTDGSVYVSPQDWVHVALDVVTLATMGKGGPGTTVAGIEVAAAEQPFVRAAIGSLFKVETEAAVTGEQALLKEAAEAPVASAGNGCFIAGTLVETSEGPKRIEEIHVGDLVRARDAGTGATFLKPVVKLYRRHNQQIFDVKLSTPDGRTEVIGASIEHPFHVRNLGWVAASKLAPGEIVDQLDGEGEHVVSVEREKSRQDTYNFEVAEVHSYFVGQNHAWVHNQSYVNWNVPLTKGYFESAYGEGNVAQGGGTALQTAENVWKNVWETQAGNASSNYAGSPGSWMAGNVIQGGGTTLQTAENIWANVLETRAGNASSNFLGSLEQPAIVEGASSVTTAAQLRAQLAFQEAGILTPDGTALTPQAIAASTELRISGGQLTNPAVISELTSDGSAISDWGKYTTQSITLPDGSRSQIHFYMNNVTGDVNFNIDFKVKSPVK